MTGEAEAWPDLLEDEYELRVTARAREDLQVEKLSAGELAEMAKASPWGGIIDKFLALRTRDPGGTEAPLSKVHRADIFKLDGRDGQRAVTWHDTEHAVVWLLAFTPDHDFEEIVRRAGSPNRRGAGGANELLPSVQDYEELQDDRGAVWAYQRAGDALEKLVGEACGAPGVVHRASLAGVVRTEALVVPGTPRRLHLRFRMPPLQKGVLHTGFHWSLTGGLTSADGSTIAEAPFPGAPEKAALSVSCELL